MRIGPLAQEAGVAVRWRPFNVRTLMAENNIALRTQTAKIGYMWRDIARRAALHGVPFVAPPVWPTDPDLLANRVAAIASAEGWAEPYSLASFRLWYLDGRPLGEPDDIARILRELGQEPDAILARARSAEADEFMAAEVEAARRSGIFGSPAFVVDDGETFWGDDRLEEAIAWACRRHPLQTDARSG